MRKKKRNPKPPYPFVDILAFIHYDDVGPMPAVGFYINDEDDKSFMIKITSQCIPWDRVVAWKYLDEVWPHYIQEVLYD